MFKFTCGPLGPLRVSVAKDYAFTAHNFMPTKNTLIAHEVPVEIADASLVDVFMAKRRPLLSEVPI